jgi:hypothetical protein
MLVDLAARLLATVVTFAKPAPLAHWAGKRRRRSGYCNTPTALERHAVTTRGAASAVSTPYGVAPSRILLGN